MVAVTCLVNVLFGLVVITGGAVSLLAAGVVSMGFYLWWENYD